MTWNIHPHISTRSHLKLIGDGLSVAGNEEYGLVQAMQTFLGSLSTGHCWIMQNGTFTALGTGIREPGTTLQYLSVLPSLPQGRLCLHNGHCLAGLQLSTSQDSIYGHNHLKKTEWTTLWRFQAEQLCDAVPSPTGIRIPQFVCAFIQNIVICKRTSLQRVWSCPMFPTGKSDVLLGFITRLSLIFQNSPSKIHWNFNLVCKLSIQTWNYFV